MSLVLKSSNNPPDAAPSRPRRFQLHTKILAGLIVGVVSGLIVNKALGGGSPGIERIVANFTEPVGQLFLRLLLMLVLPLVFSSICLAVFGLGDLRKLGRVGLKSFGFCLAISTISVAIGLLLANTLRPGKRVAPEVAQLLQERYGQEAQKHVPPAAKAKEAPLLQLVKTIVPSNPFASLASETPNLLHIMFFSLVIGVGLTLLPRDSTSSLVRVFEGIYAVSSRLIDLVMALAPFAVACLLFSNTARFGLDLLNALGWFVVTVLAGLGLHLVGVYSLILYFVVRVSPIEFFRRIKVVILTAFSTSSSTATLPTTLKVSEQNLGVPREISNFVLTVGATANQNGTALYEGVTVLFLAQLAGIDLTWTQQAIVAYLAILASLGTAGVPSGSIPFIALVLATIHINPALIAIILGVDRFLDMCRTVVNVVGDLIAAAFVAKSEGNSLFKFKTVPSSGKGRSEGGMAG